MKAEPKVSLNIESRTIIRTGHVITVRIDGRQVGKFKTTSREMTQFILDMITGKYSPSTTNPEEGQ